MSPGNQLHMGGREVFDGSWACGLGNWMTTRGQKKSALDWGASLKQGPAERYGV